MNGLLFITHQTECHSYLDGIRIALRGGCRSIQLRMKDASTAEVERTARLAKALCIDHGARLYIDDHVEVCKSVGAAGVHLGRHDMPPRYARHILGPGFAIGGTANTFDDIVQLHAAGVDYIGLGPFRFTTTKARLSPILGLEGYQNIVQQCRETSIDLPIMAIGGITPEDIPALIQTGISGIALSGSILMAADPVAQTRKIIETINAYQR